MCYLKIGREFDTHLIASETESEVSGIAASSGKVPVTSPLVSSCSAALGYRGGIQLLRISAPALGRDLHCPAFADDGWHFL